MSSFYDPWQHAANRFLNRIAQFIFLTTVIGLIYWTAMLRLYFGASWTEVLHFTWRMQDTHESLWRALFGMSFVAGALTTAWLFTWLALNGRLRTEDSFRRGAQIIERNRL